MAVSTMTTEDKPLADNNFITAEELAVHNKPGDLWISIQGKVYNVTDWAKVHPGGDVVILNLAGQDVTDAFIAYHPGTAWKHLDSLFTGYHLQDFKVSEVSRDYRKLVSEFHKAGLFEKKEHVTLFTLSSVFAMLALVVYGVLCCTSVWAHLASALLLGLLWMQSTYVGHDSGHYEVMCSKGYNKFAQILCGNCLTGISIAWWKWTHNAHHISVNSLDHDPDLQHMPVFAVSNRFFDSIKSVFYGRVLQFDALSRFLISYQHITFYPVLCVARINLYLQTILLLFSRRNVPDRAFNIAGILVFYTWFPLLVSCLPNWPERIMFTVAAMAACSIQHLQFCLNHFAANVYMGPPSGNNWFQNQAAGTLDISCSEWMDWFFGGLQFQLEHHLFPRLPRAQLRKVSPVVIDLCKKHNLPYRSLTFVEANLRTLKTLRTAALQARDLTKPAENLLWEAFHTHG